MVASTLSISIDRTSLVLSPLVIGGQRADGGVLGVVAYREPAIQARIEYAPSSLERHGDLALGFVWQQSLLSFSVVTDGATDEQDSRDAIAELVAAVSRLSYEVTVTVAGSTGETWTCDPGSVSPAGDRGVTDLRRSDPVWNVTIPCFPVRG